MSTPAALPENVLDLASTTRRWSGVSVIHARFTCAGPVMYEVPHDDEARLGMILEEVGTHRSEPRLVRGKACAIGYRPRQINFVPAGMTIWGYSADIRYARDVRLCFDVRAMRERGQLQDAHHRGDAPDFRFSDERMATLMSLLAEAVDDPDPSIELYGDALITAIAVRLFGQAATPTKPGTKLSPLQLRDALNYLEAQLPRPVSLDTLASLAGLSSAHYHRAFKAATGVAPYQWQLRARIERAQSLLLEGAHSLEDVAEATGFADAVHFGRTFRKLIGATPAAWRRDRLS